MKRKFMFVLIVLASAVMTGGCFPRAVKPSPAGQPAATAPAPVTEPAVEAPQDETPEGELHTVIAGEFLVLFAVPDTDGEAVGLIPAGETVRVLVREGVFALVETKDGQRGYVLGEYLSDAAAPPELLAGDIYIPNVDEYLSLRVSADSLAERIMKLPPGTALRILDADVNFARVEAVAYGLRGYVMTGYLAYAAGRQEQPALENKTGLHAVICREFATLRTAPDKSAAALVTLESGARVTVLGYEGAFARISAAGHEGYLLSEYTTPISGEKPDAPVYMYVDCEEYISLREHADTSAPLVKKLLNGVRVHVLGREGSFAKVRTDTGETGFVPSACLSDAGAHAEAPLYAHEGEYRVVCKDAITLRAAPDRDAAALAKLKNGTKVEVQCFDGQFAKISAGGRTGFALAGYLQAADALPGLKIVKATHSYSYKKMMSDLRALAEAYDSLTLGSIGKSAEGRDIPVVRIGDTGARYHILVQGGIHGREHMTSLLLTALVESTALCGDAAYAGVGAEKLLSDLCLHVIPMANPDGVTISQTAAVTGALRRVYQSDTAARLTRLPITQYLREWKSNANGVDLNRNFDAGWADIDSPAAPSYSRFKGDAAHDQPETRALVAYTKSRDFDATISYHAFGSVIFWEYSGNAAAGALSKDLGFALRACTGYPLAGALGLDAGGYKDWAMLQGIPSVTVEIGTRACPLPVEEFSTIWARNKKVFLAAARWVKR